MNDQLSTIAASSAPLGPAAAVGTVSLTALFVSFVGPLAGPYLLILACASIGSLCAVYMRKNKNLLDGWFIFVLCTLLSTVITGGSATALDKYFGVPLDMTICPIALALAALGDRWFRIFERLGAGVERKVELTIGELKK